jgi:hypothetical protein
LQTNAFARGRESSCRADVINTAEVFGTHNRRFDRLINKDGVLGTHRSRGRLRGLVMRPP